MTEFPLNGNNTCEIWLPVIDGEGVYEISSFGRVRSLSRTVINRGAEQKLEGKILSPRLNHGYPRVTLRLNGKTLYRFCHKLVAEAFIGPCPKGMEVRHKDGNRSNPRLNNLEYGTRSQNIADCKTHGTFKNGASHLTEELVRQIAIRHEATNAELAKEFGVSKGAIDNIRLRRTWRHLDLDLCARPLGPRKGNRHPARNGKFTPKSGEMHGSAKLTERQVQEIIGSREASSKLASIFGVHKACIENIRKGKTWKDVPRDGMVKTFKRNLEGVARGAKQGFAKLDDRQVLEILTAKDVTTYELGRRFGVTQQTISDIRCGRTWNHVTGLKKPSRNPSS